MTDVIVTGLPRSGLTAVSACIDSLPDAVCLNAPEWQITRARKLAELLPYCKWLVGDYVWTRQQLLRETPIHDYRAADGTALLDGLHDPNLPKAKSGEANAVHFTRPGLKDGFILGMKQHALYTALLPELIGFAHFKIIAVIRHPVDIIASWQRQTGPLAQGKLSDLGAFWPEVHQLGTVQGDALDRMVKICEAFFQRYHELREHIHIVRYEDVVNDPSVVGTLFGIKKAPAKVPHLGKNTETKQRDNTDAILERLRKYSVFAAEYYKLG